MTDTTTKPTIFHYGGFYFLDEGVTRWSGWVALIGGEPWPRYRVEHFAGQYRDNPDQLAEFEKALAEMPLDHVPPTPEQRRRPTPAQGASDR